MNVQVPLVALHVTPSVVVGNEVGVGGVLADSHQRHLLAYAMLSATFSYALADHPLSMRRRLVLVFGCATGYGAAIEGLQWFHPERVGSLVDVGINAAGAVAGQLWVPFAVVET